MYRGVRGLPLSNDSVLYQGWVHTHNSPIGISGETWAYPHPPLSSFGLDRRLNAPVLTAIDRTQRVMSRPTRHAG